MRTDDKQHRSILQKIAYRAMLQRRLLPDFSAEALVELRRIQAPAAINGEQVHDLRGLLWASIDNDNSSEQRGGIIPNGITTCREGVYHD